MATGSLLTTLDHVKAWLNVEQSNTDADAFLIALIRSASAFALNYMQRDSMAAAPYTEMYDGYGNSFIVLRQFPAIDVQALSFNGVAVQAATGDGFTSPFSNGFVLEAPKSAPAQQRLMLFGQIFPRMRSSVMVQYRAGYLITGESHVVLDDLSASTIQTFLEDEGVTLVDGTALTKVDEVTGPMEYSVTDDGTYNFDLAQLGEKVLISYSFVPADVEQAVWELVGERYRAQDRIGVSSKALGGQETISFDIRAMNPYIRELLNPYRRVVPV